MFVTILFSRLFVTVIGFVLPNLRLAALTCLGCHGYRERMRNANRNDDMGGQDERLELEPRILIEDPELSITLINDIFDNILIQGDKLLALKALENDAAKKCIYIDPPYNTGSAFKHYDDGIEHSIWLSLMRDRLELLRNFLVRRWVYICPIDYNEAHYLKI